MWGAIGAAAQAAGQYYANAPYKGGPKLYQPPRHMIDKYNRIAFQDAKAYNEGGIDDPRLDHLGFGPGWKEKVSGRLRDQTAGETIGDEQRLNEDFGRYGAPGVKSGVYLTNKMRIRAGRTRAMEGAMRDIELENWRQKKIDLNSEMAGAGIAGARLGNQFNDAEMSAYEAAVARHTQGGQAIGAAVGSLTDSVPAIYESWKARQAPVQGRIPADSPDSNPNLWQDVQQPEPLYPGGVPAFTFNPPVRSSWRRY